MCIYIKSIENQTHSSFRKQEEGITYGAVPAINDLMKYHDTTSTLMIR